MNWQSFRMARRLPNSVYLCVANATPGKGRQRIHTRNSDLLCCSRGMPQAVQHVAVVNVWTSSRPHNVLHGFELAHCACSAGMPVRGQDKREGFTLLLPQCLLPHKRSLCRAGFVR